MADQLWFNPVSGGNHDDGSDKFINVQWAASMFGAPAIAPVTAIVDAVFVFQTSPTLGEARLNSCYGKWSWTSEQSGGNMTKGSQLAIGTVLAHTLGGTTWSTVDVWAKFKVSNVRRLSSVYLSLSDSGTNSSSSANQLGSMVNDTWYIAHHNSSSLTNWAHSNIRGVLTFQGTTTAADVGALDVYVEWFAFGLTA